MLPSNFFRDFRGTLPHSSGNERVWLLSCQNSFDNGFAIRENIERDRSADFYFSAHNLNYVTFESNGQFMAAEGLRTATMARRRRIEIAGSVYHITKRDVDCRDIVCDVKRGGVGPRFFGIVR